MNKEYYNKVYIPDIVKWGKITMLLGIITCFGPALVISVVYGYMPPVSAIIAGTIAQISVSGAFYIVEPLSLPISTPAASCATEEHGTRMLDVF